MKKREKKFVDMSIPLSESAIKRLNDISTMSGVSLNDVINVILSMSLTKGKDKL